MRLTPEQPAPDFNTQDIYGNPIKLSDYQDKKLMICFYRYAGCPFCNLSLFRLAAHYDQLSKKGLSVIAFFQSPAESILKYPGKLHVPFPLIADPDKIIYNKFGVQSSFTGSLRSIAKAPEFFKATFKYKFIQGKVDGDLFLMPAYFLIGPPNLSIHYTRYGANFADAVPMIEVEEFLMFN